MYIHQILDTITAEITLISSGQRRTMTEMQPMIYLIGLIIGISTQDTPSKMNLWHPGYLWFAPPGECEEGVLWVHPEKSIMFGCNNQRLVYRKPNGSSTECCPSVTVAGDWWGFSNNGCPEIGCLAKQPRKRIGARAAVPRDTHKGELCIV